MQLYNHSKKSPFNANCMHKETDELIQGISNSEFKCIKVATILQDRFYIKNVQKDLCLKATESLNINVKKVPLTSII